MVDPNWSDVRVFLAIYRAGTLSGAARTLGVYASTVGRRLDALEADMGTSLFQRRSDGLIPTAGAEQMLEAAEIMERQAQLIAQGLSGQASALRGTVRLATTPDIASHFLIERLAAFHLEHPEIEVIVQTHTRMLDLTRGEADLALRFTRGDVRPMPKSHEASLIARQLPDVGIGLYASESYLDRRGRPPTARDLKGHDLVVPSQAWVPGHQWMVEHGSGCRVSLQTDALAGLVAAARAGHGIAPLPSFMVFSTPELERIRPPDHISVVHSWLLMPADLRRVARVRALWDFIIALFGEWKILMAGGEEEPLE